MVLTNVAIVLALVLYGYFGWRRGFILQLVELLIFVISFSVSLLVYPLFSHVAGAASSKSSGIIALILVLMTWFLIEFLLGLLWRRYRKRLPADLHHRTINRVAGLAPALLKAVALIGVVLLIIASAPLPTSTKDPILQAALARPFVDATRSWQTTFDQVFGQALRDTLAFKTIKTGEEGSVDLGFKKADGKVCARDEDTMLRLLNTERTQRGLGTVSADEKLRAVARAHSQDMLARGYFAHETPEGVDPFQRMAAAGITYETAGENLGFGPTVQIVHQGLMNSPGHRANILNPDYTKVGIGCIDAGIHGRMFSQEFTG